MGFRQDVRAAAVTLLTGFKTANDSALRQIYPGRPASIYPPCAFVDAINEAAIVTTRGPRLRSPAVDIIVIQGVFDSDEATAKQDELVDDFLDYCRAHFDAAGPASVVTVDRVEDLPAYVPDWIEGAPVYYATRLTLVGIQAQGGLI